MLTGTAQCSGEFSRISGEFSCIYGEFSRISEEIYRISKQISRISGGFAGVRISGEFISQCYFCWL